jgi:hypothetical protein
MTAGERERKKTNCAPRKRTIQEAFFLIVKIESGRTEIYDHKTVVVDIALAASTTRRRRCQYILLIAALSLLLSQQNKSDKRKVRCRLNIWVFVRISEAESL